MSLSRIELVEVQPYAELILRGTCGQQIMPIEFSWTSLTAGRSRPTKIIGERFYIYASKQWASGKLYLEGCKPSVVSGPLSVEKKAWSNDLAMPGSGPEPWMLELAKIEDRRLRPELSSPHAHGFKQLPDVFDTFTTIQIRDILRKYVVPAGEIRLIASPKP